MCTVQASAVRCDLNKSTSKTARASASTWISCDRVYPNDSDGERVRGSDDADIDGVWSVADGPAKGDTGTSSYAASSDEGTGEVSAYTWLESVGLGLRPAAVADRPLACGGPVCMPSGVVNKRDRVLNAAEREDTYSR